MCRYPPRALAWTQHDKFILSGGDDYKVLAWALTPPPQVPAHILKAQAEAAAAAAAAAAAGFLCYLYSYRFFFFFSLVLSIIIYIYIYIYILSIFVDFINI